MMLSLAFCVVAMPAQAAAVAPKISSITPTQTTAGTFTLTITGSNFDSGAVDQIYWKADSHFVGQGTVQSRTSSKIVVKQLMTGTTPGAYIVKVKNSNGQISNGVTLTISAAVAPMNPGNNLKLSEKGIKFLADHEGCPMKNGLVIMYNDPAGHCTIGYGHLIHLGKIDGRESEKLYKNGITKAQALDLFRNDVAKYEAAVNSNVKVQLTQYQFDALVSFTYNIGISGFKGSSALTELNKGNYNAVPDKMMLWLKPAILKNRRTAEANLFKTGNY